MAYFGGKIVDFGLFFILFQILYKKKLLQKSVVKIYRKLFG